MKIIKKALSDITPYHRNPRNNQNAVEGVANSINEFGWQQPIVVDKEFVIIAGHTRYEAARYLGLKEMPVYVAEGLSKQQCDAYRIADNRTHEDSLWNDELLKLEMLGLKESDYDLTHTGFTDTEIEALMNAELVKVENKNVEAQATFSVVVECRNLRDQKKLLKLLAEKGYECEAEYK